MKEFNFNTIKSLPVPEQWIENALLIPEVEEKKPAVIPLWCKPRFIAMAASVMLVTALSIALFLSMGNKPPVSVKSDTEPDVTQIVWSTDAYGATLASEIVVIPDDGIPNATEKPSALSRSFEIVFGGNDSTSPTAPSSQGSSAPDDDRHGRTPQSPTVSPQQPTAAPSSVTPDPDATLQPAETDPPKEPSTTAPWHRPPTESPWERPPVKPTELPSDKPWEQLPTVPPKPTDSTEYCDAIDITFWGTNVPYGRKLYVRLFYEGKGSAPGDRDPFSDQHLATILSWDADTIHVYYDPREHGIALQGGYYRYEIYRQALPGYQAVIVEKSGSIYLNP